MCRYIERQPSSAINAMTLTRSFSAEVWIPDRGAFVFQFRDRRFSDLATFCVPQATLRELQPEYPFLAAAAFEALRPLIYQAAVERIRTGGTMVQHVMTPHELRVLRHATIDASASKQSATG